MLNVRHNSPVSIPPAGPKSDASEILPLRRNLTVSHNGLFSIVNKNTHFCKIISVFTEIVKNSKKITLQARAKNFVRILGSFREFFMKK